MLHYNNVNVDNYTGPHPASRHLTPQHSKQEDVKREVQALVGSGRHVSRCERCADQRSHVTRFNSAV